MNEEDVQSERERWIKFERQHPVEIEVPGPGQESVWDYPRPPKVEEVAQRMRVVFNGIVVAESERGLRVCETSSPPCYYFPPQDVKLEYLVRTSKHSLCEWKGQATYWDLRVGETLGKNVAWSYENPFTDIADYGVLKSYLAFYVAPMDGCYLGDERVRPQPGIFYGGWVTDTLTGPFKGVPGSQFW